MRAASLTVAPRRMRAGDAGAVTSLRQGAGEAAPAT
jgi:hypothetical protein